MLQYIQKEFTISIVISIFVAIIMLLTFFHNRKSFLYEKNKSVKIDYEHRNNLMEETIQLYREIIQHLEPLPRNDLKEKQAFELYSNAKKNRESIKNIDINFEKFFLNSFEKNRHKEFNVNFLNFYDEYYELEEKRLKYSYQENHENHLKIYQKIRENINNISYNINKTKQKTNIIKYIMMGFTLNMLYRKIYFWPIKKTKNVCNKNYNN